MAEPKPICPAVNAAVKQKRLSYQQLANKLRVGQSENVVVSLVPGNSSISNPILQNVAEALEIINPVSFLVWSLHFSQRIQSSLRRKFLKTESTAADPATQLYL